MTSTLVDSNILIDLLNERAVPQERDWSSTRLLEMSHEGALCVSAVVWAEVTQPYDDVATIRRLVDPLGLVEEPFPFAAAYPAGQAHRRYRERGGRRERTLSDFLIGAHALVAGHRLLTRDPGRYRAYFPDLSIVCPETHP